MDYCDIEWFVLETNRDHSVVFKIVPKYCISDYFIGYEGYSISSKEFFFFFFFNFQCYLFIFLQKAFLSFIFSLGLEIHFKCYLNKVFRGINKKHLALHHLEEEHII